MFVLSLLAIATVATQTASAGPITYQINDYPAKESGYKISGSITTDGTIGTLASSHVTAWTWTLSDSTGSTVYGTASSTDSGTGIFERGTVTASATQITMTPTAEGYNQFDLYNGVLLANNGIYLSWYRSPTNGDDFSAAYDTQIFDSSSPSSPGLALPDLNTWVIATVASPPAAVPEPSTFALLGLGGIGFVVRTLRRRRVTF